LQSGIGVRRPIERPVAGFVLSLVGGLIVTGGTIYTFLEYAGSFYYGYATPYLAYGVLGSACGFGILLGCALAYLLPRHHVGWGILIIVFGVASLFALYGIFFIFVLVGTPLAVIGGSLIVGWKPERELRFEDYRTCLACGRHVLAEYAVCPHCGTRAGGKEPPSIPPSTLP